MTLPPPPSGGNSLDSLVSRDHNLKGSDNFSAIIFGTYLRFGGLQFWNIKFGCAYIRLFR